MVRARLEPGVFATTHARKRRSLQTSYELARELLQSELLQQNRLYPATKVAEHRKCPVCQQRGKITTCQKDTEVTLRVHGTCENRLFSQLTASFQKYII